MLAETDAKASGDSDDTLVVRLAEDRLVAIAIFASLLENETVSIMVLRDHPSAARHLVEIAPAVFEHPMQLVKLLFEMFTPPHYFNV